MTRFFYIVFFSFLVLGISCIVAAFFVTEKPLEIIVTELKDVPLEKQIEKATTNQIHIVRVCQGDITRPIAEDAPTKAVDKPTELEGHEVKVDAPVVSEIEQTPVLFNASLDIPDKVSETPTAIQPEKSPTLKRTYIFLASDEGVPEIITAKVIRSNEKAAEVSTVSISDANQPMIAEHGLRAEHGTLAQLRDLDYARQQSHYSELLDNAKVLCFNSDTNSEIDQNLKMEFLKTQATAYIQLDLDLDAANSKVLIFYQVNGFIHQQEAFLTDRPI